MYDTELYSYGFLDWMKLKNADIESWKKHFWYTWRAYWGQTDPYVSKRSMQIFAVTDAYSLYWIYNLIRAVC